MSEDFSKLNYVNNGKIYRFFCDKQPTRDETKEALKELLKYVEGYKAPNVTKQ